MKEGGKVVYLRSRATSGGAIEREAMRRMAARAAEAARGALRLCGSAFMFLMFATWQVLRVGICALLVLIEPLLSVMLVPLAFLSFVITVIFGFLIGAPHFPRWEMLGLSVGLVLVYWLFLGLMSLFMRLPPHHDLYR